VDHLQRVRWRGCGKSKPEEIETLISCAEELLRMKGGDVPVLSTKSRAVKKKKDRTGEGQEQDSGAR
jgi:hypothetical protein